MTFGASAFQKHAGKAGNTWLKSRNHLPEGTMSVTEAEYYAV